MRCVVVDVDDDDQLHLKTLLACSPAVTEVITFSRIYEALLFTSKNLVDIMFLNMESPHVYQAVSADRDFDPSTFLVLNASKKGLFNDCKSPAGRQVHFIYKPFLQEEIVDLTLKFHKMLSF